MNKYSLSTRLFHWFSATLVLFLFFSGWYMVQLDYYSPWYTLLPQWHILTGVLLIFLWAVVLLRTYTHPSDKPNHHHAKWERLLSLVVKLFIYLSVIIMLLTGYLMTTADGNGYDLFNWIYLPAVSHFSAHQIDTLGAVHEYVSYFLMSLVSLHVLGVIKHQLIDQDQTLNRML